jgi:ribosomal protein L40E
MGLFREKKCPKCDSKNLNKVKPSLSKRAKRGSMFLLVGPLALMMKEPKTLNVCRDCGFSWEDR